MLMHVTDTTQMGYLSSAPSLEWFLASLSHHVTPHNMSFLNHYTPGLLSGAAAGAAVFAGAVPVACAESAATAAVPAAAPAVDAA